MFDKIKGFLGIKGKKEKPKVNEGATYESPVKFTAGEIEGSESASMGVGSDSSSTKVAIGRHHKKHGSVESKSASKGVGSGTGSTVAIADTESTSYASDKVDVPVDATKYSKNDSTVDLAASQHYDALPVAGQVAKSAKDVKSKAKGGFVDPDGNRLSDDDVKMMKVMLTQVLESYIDQINLVYDDTLIAFEMNDLPKGGRYVRFLETHLGITDSMSVKSSDVKGYRDRLKGKEGVSEGDIYEYLGGENKLSYAERAEHAAIDAKAKRELISNVQKKISNLSKALKTIQKGKETRVATAFLEEYLEDAYEYHGKQTNAYTRLLKSVKSNDGMADFLASLNAAKAGFESTKDEVLDGVDGIGNYKAKDAKKLAGGRMQGSTTLAGELKNLFISDATFKEAIINDEVIKAANGGKVLADDTEPNENGVTVTAADKFAELRASNHVVNGRVLDILEKKKLSGKAKSVMDFSKAADVASKHAQKIKSKSSVSYSDLVQAYMDLNLSVGDTAKDAKGGKSKDGKLDAVAHGTQSGSILGPAGDRISSALLQLFAFVANAMNEIKAIQKKQPDVAKSRAIKLAGIVDSMTISMHTFVNGNGRTCRLLADTILEALGLPPAAVNKTIQTVGGTLGKLYVGDDQKAAGQKDFDRSTQGFLQGVRESSSLMS